MNEGSARRIRDAARDLDVPDIGIIAQTHHNSLRTLDIYSRPETAARHHPVNELAARLAAVRQKDKEKVDR